MLRGITKIVCKDCGHTFKGMDIEDNATIYSMPMKLPKCGSMHTIVCAFTGMFIDLICLMVALAISVLG